MNARASVTGRFIAAVRRRMAVVCIAESVAVGMAVAAVLGLAMIPILWWRGESGLMPGVAMLILGGSCGLLRGLTRIPTRMQAAVEADRQLGLRDLLSTVYLMKHPADSWEASLAAIGDSQCRRLRPSAVIVGHLGIRAWGGVGILGSLLIALGLFTSRPPSVRAADSALPSNPSAASLMVAAPSPAIADSSGMNRPPGPGGTDEINNREFEQDRPDDSQTTASSNADSAHNPASGDSSGGGMAVTHSHSSQMQPPIVDVANDDPQVSRAGTGTGVADANARMPGNPKGGLVSENSAAHSPPWESDRWGSDAAAAQSDVAEGRVPDSDADLVRDYFQRD